MTFSFPGIWIIVKSKFCIFIISLSILVYQVYGQLQVGKACPLSRYICRRDVVSSAAKVSRSIWEYLLSVSVSV